MINHHAHSEFPRPGDGGGLTSHQFPQLDMAGNVSHSDPPTDDSPDRPSRRYVRIESQPSEGLRPAVIEFPEEGAYAVLHTAEDRHPDAKARSRAQYEHALRERLTEWDAPRVIRDMIWQADSGEFDDLARREGYDSPISYVLHVIESAERPADHIQGGLLKEVVGT